MTTTATLMMIVAMLVVWGGLLLAVFFLARHPLEDQRPDDVFDDPETRHHL
ncbi:methionine/alanine import family NSS transporter small subunit [Georgenia sp. EYE_87]|uniref:methionine/alanine import family NSS transporter small subunit n=1 Tax=Georgenia sp. EYE_87 TaxID=2853448 RepID=UPI0020050214|nr:methionine/alanine import family NSS transporter small subunit [Georgenia sp. EYE_87]MCK6209524.1 methionine/alanine import family NSS transporter small subunit [Georgenia sp. EYE_87]